MVLNQLIGLSGDDGMWCSKNQVIYYNLERCVYHEIHSRDVCGNVNNGMCEFNQWVSIKRRVLGDCELVYGCFVFLWHFAFYSC